MCTTHSFGETHVLVHSGGPGIGSSPIVPLIVSADPDSKSACWCQLEQHSAAKRIFISLVRETTNLDVATGLSPRGFPLISAWSDCLIVNDLFCVTLAWWSVVDLGLPREVTTSKEWSLREVFFFFGYSVNTYEFILLKYIQNSFVLCLI